MKILVVSQFYYPEPFRINEICEELVKRGHNVTVLTTNPNYPDGDIYKGYKSVYSEEYVNGIKVIRCKSRPRYKGAFNLALNYISFASSASFAVKKINEQFDVVYMYQLSPITSCFPAIKYKKRHKVPLYLYCLDIWPESLKGTIFEKGLVFTFIKWLSIKIYREADAIAVTSPSFVGYISNLCSISKDNIHLLFQHSDSVIDKKDSNQNSGKYCTYTNFLFAGNIGESQNIECLIRAVSHVKNRDRIRFHIVGSGSYLEIAKQLAKDLSVDDVVIFYGRFPKSEMYKFYSIADVCVVSLKDEGVVGYTIPGKVQEYMSAGKAILACINGDTADLINKVACGVAVKADDDKELAKAMDYLIETDKLSEFGDNGKKYYLHNFTLRHHVDELENQLNKLIK